ncbi:MAG: glycosyltransferase family 2 protein [Nitrososphaerota archaeon]|nr:glycosyltransferase family 2 protein [Nitrososphaerota archaeon]
MAGPKPVNGEIGVRSRLKAVRVAVLIPAYNEEGSIAKVVIQSLAHSDHVVVCDDGSTDMTAKIAESLGARVIRHARNMGYGASLSSLFQSAIDLDVDAFVTLDADGQHDPTEVPALVGPVADGTADIAIGSRFLGKGSEVPGYRGLGIRAITDVSNRLNDTDLTDAQSGFRAYNRKALGAVTPSDLGMGASTEILLKASRAGLRIVEVPVGVSYPPEGSSRNPVFHGGEVLFSSIKHISILHPLLVYGVPGFALLLYGTYLGTNALRIYQEAHRVVTGTTLIAMGSILVGLILCITALILWIMITLMRDPQYRNDWSAGNRARAASAPAASPPILELP